MNRIQRLELLVQRIAVSTIDGARRFIDLYKEEVNKPLEGDEVVKLGHNEMLQGFEAVFFFNDDPSIETIILTAKTMVGFYLNDKLKEVGINISEEGESMP